MTKYEEDTKVMQEYAKIKVKCKYCGHTNTMPVLWIQEYVIIVKN